MADNDSDIVFNYVSSRFIGYFNQHNHSTANSPSTCTPKRNVLSRTPGSCTSQPSSRGGSSKTTRNRTENTAANMEDNNSQPGTSAGSSKNINNTITGNEIGCYTKHIHGNTTIHQSTPSTPAPKGNPINNVERANMAGSSSQQAEKIANVRVDYVKYANVTMNQSTSSTHAPRRNPINNIELAVKTFIGRETELNDIKKLFHEYPVVVIAAMGGMGKTQLARKFAAVNAKRYRDRYWINAETEAQLLKSFDRLAEKVNVKANNDVDTVRNTYQSFTEGAALLIFDNVEDVNYVYRYLPTRIQLEDITLHVLVTSRWTEWTSDSSVNCYQLQALDISVSLQLFQNKFGETCIKTMQEEWEKLAGMLGNLPLALQVAASYIYKRTKHNTDLPTALADYMKQLKEGADALLNNPLPEYDNRTVYVSMMLSLKLLQNKADNESNVQNNVQWQLAVTVINVVSYMNPDRIYKERLLKLVDNHENIICKLDEALEILVDYSLLNQGDGSEEDTFYSVHRVIQTSVRHNQSLMGTADTYYIRVFKCALADDYYSWEVAQFANERASAVTDYYKNYPSPGILKYLVKNNAITAIEAALQLSSKYHHRITIKQHRLLHHAVDWGHLKMSQLLFEYGADINQQRSLYDGPPIHTAVRRGNVEILKWLLENSVAPTVRDEKGRNALHVAIMTENHNMVPTLINIDRALVNVTDVYGQTPLHVINYDGNEEDILSTTRVLVESGADIAKVNRFGNTVLHLAAEGTCAAAVSLILQINKDLVNIINEDGQTALHVILVPYNSTRIDDERILPTMRVLVAGGVDLTKVDKYGDTVLHLAAKRARVAAISLILQLNKDLIDIKNKDGETALHVIPYDDTDIDNERILSTMRVLVAGGVDLTKVDKKGNTVLHLSAKGARAETVSLILQLNKDLINIVNEKGTALHVIPYDDTRIDDERILSTMRVLVAGGVDLTKVDKDGNTVLHFSAKGARAETVSLILQLNKDLINIKNKGRQTALHVLGNRFNYLFQYQSKEKRKQLFARVKEAARVLIMNGLSLDTRDISGRTLLDTVLLEVKNILLDAADECNNQ